MTAKVLYIAFAPLTARISHEWYIDLLTERGITVEYWNLSTLVDGLEEGHDSKVLECVRTFASLAEFEAALALPENRAAVCIMLMGYGGRFVPIYRLISKYGGRTVYVAWGDMPQRSSQKWKARALTLLNSRDTAIRLLQKVRANTYSWLGLVGAYDVVFSSARDVARFRAHQIVTVNSNDYEKFVKARTAPRTALPSPYAVFLDIFLPRQSDIKFEKRRTVDPHNYFTSLNRFFDLIEAKFAVKVVIAAHPKAQYSPETFKGRSIIYGKTAEVVRDCQFVISHHSTSIGYAVLNAAPAIFVYTQEMLELYRHQQVASIFEIANFLHSSIYNIDTISSDDQIELKTVNAVQYDKYKYQFLATPETEGLETQEIFYNEIHRLVMAP